jgi:polar amino acid transport system substrate-binding protein
MRPLRAALLATLLATLLAGLPAGLASAPALAGGEAGLAPVRIATEGAHPPFNYVENGAPAGFEVELGRALCAAAKLTCTVVLHQWDGIIKGLEAREYDAIMSTLAITPRRRARIAFTRPYYRIPTSLMAAKDADLPALAADALRARTVGVVEGSAAETYLVTRFPSAVARVFAATPDAGLDLGAGRLDLVLADKLSVAAFLATPEGACCRLLADVPAGDPLLGEGVGIGLRREDEALRTALDAALAAIQADGTYDRIRRKYLAFDVK